MAINIKKIKLADKCRDFSWILERFESNQLSLLGDSFNKGSFDKFRMAIKCVQEVYENQWDIDINEVDGKVDITGVIIHFPEVLLKNSRDKQHSMSNLFVKIHLRKDGTNIKVGGLSGGRTSVSYAEYCSNYFHSHLPGSFTNQRSSQSPFYSSFCTGSGHINDFIAEINSETLTRERMIPFLVQIISLVSWESLEGGPHRKISNIRVNSNRGRISNPSQQDSLYLKNKVIDYHKDNEIIPNIDFKLESGQYTIVDNEKFNKFLTETVQLTDTDKRRVICMQDNQGNYYQYGSIPGYELPPNTSNHKYIFQGREIPFEIGSPPDIGDLTNIHYFLHPEVKSFIKQELEYDINIKKVRQSTIDRYSNQTSDATESVASN